ncbi:MAG: glycosyltransferase family 2 protein [Candidatus Bipolaricaulaceae bacterium]
MRPVVSVVIPTLNEEENIHRCLRALADQTFQQFEVLVVDGGSTDGTVAVAEAGGAHVLTLQERGIARARQLGFQAARGDIVASTDADAVLPPQWLEAIVAVFADPAVVAVFGTTRFSGAKDVGGAILRAWQRLHHLVGCPMLLGPNSAVRREAFHAARGFLEPGGTLPCAYPEADDFLLGLKLKPLGKVLFLPRVCVVVSARRLTVGSFPRQFALYARRYLQILFWHWSGKLRPDRGVGYEQA